MGPCYHRECDSQAAERISTLGGHEDGQPVYWVVEVCRLHAERLHEAEATMGGMSQINTEDNVYGWQIELTP